MRARHLVIFSAALSCTAASFPDYPFKPAAEYANVVAQSNLTVALIAIEDSQDQHKYFGMDLRPKGYVPVFLIIENQSSTDSVIFRKEDLLYSATGRSGSTISNATGPRKTDKALAVAAALPTIYTFMATVIVSKTTELKQNVLKRELQSATVSPGESVHGFVYVPAHWTHSTRDPIFLTIPLKRPGSDEAVIMDVKF